jgi:hypothetical protein
MKRWIKFLDLFILIFISLGLAFYLTENYKETKLVEECFDLNLIPSFSYEACYDSYTKTIFLGIKRFQDSYNITDIKVSLFDISEKNYSLGIVPALEKEEVYKIPAEKNPQNLDIYLEPSHKNFYEKICGTPKKIFVGYCPESFSSAGLEVLVGPLKNFGKKDYIEVESFVQENPDLLSLSLVDREKIWATQCDSNWECSSWGPCENGIQKRTCLDKNNCFIPTNMPETTKFCGDECIESWQCKWSDCNSGFTTPTCTDLNNCGTTYDLPQKIRCSGSECIPEIECSTWTTCEINYSFIDLVNQNFKELSGIKRRICSDKNHCVPSVEEITNCTSSIDIYTKTVEKCGTQFILIYNRLDNQIIARVEMGSPTNPYINFVLDEGIEEIYCDYCFDGVLNGDEEKVDCGGSCIPCSQKYK